MHLKLIRVPILLVSFSGLLSLAECGEPERRTISVSVDQEVTAEPDFATLDFGVVTENAELTDAKKDNDERVRRVLQCLREFKIAPADIKTSHVHISTEYEDYRDRDPSRLYYQYWKGFRVTVRQLDDFEAVFNGVIAAGVNDVQAVAFDITNRKTLEKDARERAIQAAKDQAERLAQSFGQEVGLPLSIKDYAKRSYGFGGGMGGSMSASGRDEPTFARGLVSIEAGITVEFKLLDVNAVNTVQRDGPGPPGHRPRENPKNH